MRCPGCIGPMPVETAHGRISVALDDSETSQVERAYLLMYLGELDAMHGSFDDARKHLAQSKQLHLEFSQEFALVTAWPRGRGRDRDCSRAIRWQRQKSSRSLRPRSMSMRTPVGSRAWWPSVPPRSSRPAVSKRRYPWPSRRGRLRRQTSSAAQITWRSALARALAATGNDADGERYAIEAVELARTTEAPGYQAEALLALAEAGARRRPPAATVAIVGEALQRLTDKGNIARVAQIRA